MITSIIVYRITLFKGKLLHHYPKPLPLFNSLLSAYISRSLVFMYLISSSLNMKGSCSLVFNARFNCFILRDRVEIVSIVDMVLVGSAYRSVWSLSTLSTISSSTASISLPVLALSSRNSANVCDMGLHDNVNGALSLI